MNIKWNFKERREPELKIIRSKENGDLIIVPIEKINYKENNNMKELTFKEVITNIKEGETWLSSVYEIKKDKEGIQVKRLDKNVEQDDNEIPFMYFYDINHPFTLQRKQYTFEEAFKSFEKGREIESVISGRGFKIRDSVSVYITKDKTINTVNDEIRLFTHNEIRGKWYIND